MQNEEGISVDRPIIDRIHRLTSALAMLACDLLNARGHAESMERIADSMSDGNRVLVRKINELENAAKEAGERLAVTMKEKAELEAQAQALKDGKFPAGWMVNRDDRGTVVGIHWGGRYYRATAIDDAFGCFEKRKPGEPVFVLLGRDPEGAATIRFWADTRSARSFADNSFVFEKSKIDQARENADAFDKWRIENGSSAKPRGNGDEPRPMVPRRPED